MYVDISSGLICIGVLTKFPTPSGIYPNNTLPVISGLQSIATGLPTVVVCMVPITFHRSSLKIRDKTPTEDRKLVKNICLYSGIVNCRSVITPEGIVSSGE